MYVQTIVNGDVIVIQKNHKFIIEKKGLNLSKQLKKQANKQINKRKKQQQKKLKKQMD